VRPSIVNRSRQPSAGSPAPPADLRQRNIDRDKVVLAITRSHEGRHDEAIRLLSEVARRHPTDASIRSDLAMALLSGGYLEEATDGFLEALRLDPRSAQAQCGLGLAHQQLQRWREAAEAFRITEMLAPDQPAGPFNLGLALQALGEHEEARRALLRAAALAPGDAEISAALAALPASAPESDSDSGAARFTGDLGTFGLPEVLELMRAQRKTGALVISSREGVGTVRLVNGRLTSASAPGASRPGDARVNQQAALRQILDGLAPMLSWREGAFSFHPGAPPAAPVVSFDTQQVVMELFRMTEERSARRSST
jgi:Flp pilus assembly protein TadD